MQRKTPKAARGTRVILLQPDAPAQPPPGAPCNGCGVCCAWAPCPLGTLLSLRLRGPCRMLRWRPEAGRYHCGALDVPADDRSGDPAGAAAAHNSWARLRIRLVRRWIAAGAGCDCTLVSARGDGSAD